MSTKSPAREQRPRTPPGRTTGPGIAVRAVAFLAGCVATAVGVGLGLPHLAKTGISPTAIAGMVCLTTGLVLVGAGGISLVRAVPGWWRVLAVPVLLSVLLISLTALGQAVAATNVPHTAVGAETPGSRGLAFTEVEFATADGVTLSGWYIPSANRAAVVVLHGAGSTRSDVLDHAVVLARHGYGVLLFDARGHGRSEGRAMDFGWYGDLDVGAAATYLETRPDVDGSRIGVLGLSMGGEEAIGAAAADTRIRAVVAEGATNRTTADRAWMSDEYGWRGTVQEGLEWLTYQTTALLTPANAPIGLRTAVLAAAPRRVLLIAGGAIPDEEHAGRYIRSGSPGTVGLWVVPQAGHTAGLRTDPGEWERRITRFLDEALT
ncbi:alpha/beta hydrolase [Kribbella sp. NPDC050124]|uniref:alpha/beta hydrolase n=1 Tax=Kribbella sp. NPDC050124 TaxID=3364114 RepID=UPI0037B1C3EE